MSKLPVKKQKRSTPLTEKQKQLVIKEYLETPLTVKVGPGILSKKFGFTINQVKPLLRRDEVRKAREKMVKDAVIEDRNALKLDIIKLAKRYKIGHKKVRDYLEGYDNHKRRYVSEKDLNRMIELHSTRTYITYDEIGQELDLHPSTVREYLKKHGRQVKQKGQQWKDEMVFRYLTEEITHRELGEIYGIHKDRVGQIIAMNTERVPEIRKKFTGAAEVFDRKKGKAIPDHIQESIAELLSSGDFSQKDITRMYDMYQSVVSSIARKHSVPEDVKKTFASTKKMTHWLSKLESGEVNFVLNQIYNHIEEYAPEATCDTAKIDKDIEKNKLGTSYIWGPKNANAHKDVLKRWLYLLKRKQQMMVMNELSELLFGGE